MQVKSEEENNDLKISFLKLIRENIPLIDFPLLDYTSDEVYNILFELRNSGMITISFGNADQSESNEMRMVITEKGNELLKNQERLTNAK